MAASPSRLLWPAGVFLFLAAACSDSGAGADPTAEGVSRTASSVSDKPIEPFQSELIDLAFKAASALPLNPHVKDRSRAQEAVVAACLELDQPRRALGFIERIDHWRRGAAYADLAFHCAQHGSTTQVQGYLDRALQVAGSLTDDNAQEWQRDRIRVKIARTHAWLGKTREADEFEAGVVDSETGKVDAVEAMHLDADAFDERIASLNRLFATGNFDQVRNALESSAQLFNRFYADVERRSQVEARIKASWSKLPIAIRVEVMMELAGFALEHVDSPKALELVDEAEQIMAGSKPSAEVQVPLMARLAGLRWRAGDREKARRDADAALAFFCSERESVVNIDRAGTLRPVAEAYQTMEDRSAALTVYRLAVEAGVENVNSRPRAEDLSATCCSMALHGVEPDTTLRSRMIQICDELGHPW